MVLTQAKRKVNSSYVILFVKIFLRLICVFGDFRLERSDGSTSIGNFKGAQSFCLSVSVQGLRCGTQVYADVKMPVVRGNQGKGKDFFIA